MRRPSLPTGDAGVALITVVLMAALLAGLGVAVTATTVNNLGGAGRDRAATGALGVAEAGVADAIGYLRTKGTAAICPTCISAWNTSAPGPVTRTYGTGAAVVSIQEVAKYAPPTTRAGRYLIKSVATTPDSRPGKRTIEQLVEIQPLSFPMGVYVNGHLNLNGQVKLQQESVFSSSCVDSRNKLSFLTGPSGSNVDPYNKIPAGVHSVSYIVDAQRTNCTYSDAASAKAGDNSVIHKTSTCNDAYPYDQDGSPLGGRFTGGTCLSKTTTYGDYDDKGSEFSDDVMRNTYGFKPRGLTDDEYATLKAKAKAAGTYFGASDTIVWPTASTNPSDVGYSPIIYIENRDITINTNLNSYAWVSDVGCTSVHPNFVLVVANGNLSVGSNGAMTGYIFVPDGNVDYTGGAQLTGTIFAKDLKLGGGGSTSYNVGLNECFASYTNGGILAVTKVRFREVDDAANNS